MKAKRGLTSKLQYCHTIYPYLHNPTIVTYLSFKSKVKYHSGQSPLCLLSEPAYTILIDRIGANNNIKQLVNGGRNFELHEY